MTRVFADTGGRYALVDARDPDHDRVVECARAHRDHLLASNYVFDETLALARYRLGRPVARRLGERLRGDRLTRPERVTPRDEEAAWSIFTRYHDKAFSFTDCTRLALASRLGLRRCITLDADFRSFGLDSAP